MRGLLRNAFGRATIAKPAPYPAARASIHSISASVVRSVRRYQPSMGGM